VNGKSTNSGVGRDERVKYINQQQLLHTQNNRLMKKFKNAQRMQKKAKRGEKLVDWQHNAPTPSENNTRLFLLFFLLISICPRYN
jgi:hypothetical protein